MHLQRRHILLGAAAELSANVSSAFPICQNVRNEVCNVTQLYSIHAESVLEIKDVGDIQKILRAPTKWVSVGGGRYSMGGQTALMGGVQMDMRGFNRIVWIDAEAKTARVQAGVRWRDLQTVLDPLGLSVRTMQSYANFTVGGSVSVNCHGRYIGHGAIIHSVRSLQLVMPDGQLIEANRQTNKALFLAAVGGYGSVGVITEVELNLDDNFPIERSTERVAVGDYADWFMSNVYSDETVLLHNADLTPPSFDRPFAVTWRRTTKPVTVEQRLHPVNQADRLMQTGIWAMTELPHGHRLRTIAQKIQEKPQVVWRNYEASLDVRELEPTTRKISTYVLQEYFVPMRAFNRYVRELSNLMQEMKSQTLNISIRHSKADPDSLMSWAKEDVFCFVVYYKQRMKPQSEESIGSWTRAMIDLAMKHGGSYYLPYQPHATQSQFERAYSNVHALRQLRKEIGATRLSNAMWERYKV
jgi:FAD/FMN-containing dehydrogenase